VSRILHLNRPTAEALGLTSRTVKLPVRRFVRAGTDRDSVVSVGVLRQSLRVRHMFGCSGFPIRA